MIYMFGKLLMCFMMFVFMYKSKFDENFNAIFGNLEKSGNDF